MANNSGLRTIRLSAASDDGYVIVTIEDNPDMPNFIDEQIEFPTFTLNRQGIITEWPPLAEEAFGYNAEYALNKPFIDVLVPDGYKVHYASCLESLWNSLNSHEEIDIYTLKHGHGILLNTTLRFCKPANDSDTLHFTVNKVVFNRYPDELKNKKELTPENNHCAQYCRQIMESAPLVIVVLSTDGTVRYLNSLAENTLGYGMEALRGQNFWERVLPGNYYAQIELWFKAMEADDGKIQNYLMTLVHSAGDERHITWNTLLHTHSGGALTEIIMMGCVQSAIPTSMHSLVANG